MLVEDVVAGARKRLVMIGADASLIEAARHLGHADTDIVVVCGSDGGLAGVITKTDVVRQISGCQGSGCTTPAAAVMTRDVLWCEPGDDLHEVWERMKERRLKNIPIVGEKARPIGVLNARDALQALLGAVEDEEALMRDYVMGVGYR